MKKQNLALEKCVKKRHPVYFYRNFGRCKFGEYCSYRHPQKEESPAEKEVKELKQEVCQLKTDIDELKEKISGIEPGHKPGYFNTSTY